MAMIVSPSCTPAAPAAGDDAGIVTPRTVFCAPVVQGGIERERPRARDGPAGQHAGELGHVRLRVPTVHAERVQLHHLAGVVLVGRAGAARVLVEIREHRRTVRARVQQCREGAERVRADHVAVVDGLQVADLPHVDVEVIAPELHHALVELARRERGAGRSSLPAAAPAPSTSWPRRAGPGSATAAATSRPLPTPTTLSSISSGCTWRLRYSW